ncbi:DUF192 domain-containing protein [Candidatus Peregrinibacteria bacterium]|nr:DUF192 domain-containing protein [Candidatus Peregrinibacteria bacterium]
MKKLLLLTLIPVFLFSGCALTDAFTSVISGSGLPTKTITIETAKKQVKVKAEVADESAERAKGLMDREKLADGKGMWFVFESEGLRSFWMKNTKFPLDVIFFNKNKEIVSFVENMEPCITPKTNGDCRTYQSYKPAMYALEVPAGFVKANEIKVGQKVAD